MQLMVAILLSVNLDKNRHSSTKGWRVVKGTKTEKAAIVMDRRVQKLEKQLLHRWKGSLLREALNIL